MEIWLVILFLSRKTFHAKQTFVLSSSMKLGPGQNHITHKWCLKLCIVWLIRMYHWHIISNLRVQPCNNYLLRQCWLWKEPVWSRRFEQYTLLVFIRSIKKTPGIWFLRPSRRPDTFLGQADPVSQGNLSAEDLSPIRKNSVGWRMIYRGRCQK